MQQYGKGGFYGKNIYLQTRLSRGGYRKRKDPGV